MQIWKAREVGFNGRAVARPIRSFWPVRKNSDQFGQTRPVGGMAGLEYKKNARYVNIRACSRSQP